MAASRDRQADVPRLAPRAYVWQRERCLRTGVPAHPETALACVYRQMSGSLSQLYRIPVYGQTFATAAAFLAALPIAASVLAHWHLWRTPLVRSGQADAHSSPTTAGAPRKPQCMDFKARHSNQPTRGNSAAASPRWISRAGNQTLLPSRPCRCRTRISMTSSLLPVSRVISHPAIRSFLHWRID